MMRKVQSKRNQELAATNVLRQQVCSLVISLLIMQNLTLKVP